MCFPAPRNTARRNPATLGSASSAAFGQRVKKAGKLTQGDTSTNKTYLSAATQSSSARRQLVPDTARPVLATKVYHRESACTNTDTRRIGNGTSMLVFKITLKNNAARMKHHAHIRDALWHARIQQPCGITSRTSTAVPNQRTRNGLGTTTTHRRGQPRDGESRRRQRSMHLVSRIPPKSCRRPLLSPWQIQQTTHRR